jgi:hypothetical protein
MAKNNLLDFLQGASNSVASNVSAPVDGIAWLLRKAGLNVGTPVGGSDWMAQQGLTAEPQNKMAGLLGESFGGVAPILAAAKAPQIANGLIRMGENAAIPTTMNRQAGMIDPALLGLKVNKDGTVSLYHGTTAQAANDIVKSNTLKSAGEPNVYLTTAKDAGYGDGTLVQVDVNPRHLNLDDEFPDGRMDFSMDAPKKFAKVMAARFAK